MQDLTAYGESYLFCFHIILHIYIYIFVVRLMFNNLDECTGNEWLSQRMFRECPSTHELLISRRFGISCGHWLCFDDNVASCLFVLAFSCCDFTGIVLIWPLAQLIYIRNGVNVLFNGLTVVWLSWIAFSMGYLSFAANLLTHKCHPSMASLAFIKFKCCY